MTRDDTVVETAMPAATAAPDASGDAAPGPLPQETALQTIMRDPDYQSRSANPVRHEQLVQRALHLRQEMLGVDAEATAADEPPQGKSDDAAGSPESPDDYDLPRPNLSDGATFDDDLAATARGWFHDAGLSQTEARAVWDRFHAHSLKAVATTPEAQAAARESAERTLRREWGAAYEKNVGQAEALVRSVGGEGLVALLDQTRAGNDPALVRLVASLAERGVSGLTKDRAALELARVMGEAAYTDRFHPNHGALVDRAFRLNAHRANGQRAGSGHHG
ncbi:MAG: hypothetical protein AAF563_12370 [Pseudomonadota bacterium]